MTIIWTLCTLGLLISVIVSESVKYGRLVLPSEGFPTILGLGVACAIYPIMGFVMYSPRTIARHIEVGTDDGVPALVLRQSSAVFVLAIVQLAALTLMLCSLLLDAHQRKAGDEHALLVTIVYLFVSSAWQAGYFTFVLLGRIRRGYIAIHQYGVHIRDTATDTRIPWHTLTFTTLSESPFYVIMATNENSGVVRRGRVPRLWQIVDDKLRKPQVVAKYFGGSFHQVDRRRFQIAPELIDAALEHYMLHPEHRDELRNPAAIARVVDALRSHAPGPWWRSQSTPVQVPALTTVP